MIKCIDEVSSEVSKIGKSLEGMQKDVNVNNKKLQTSFDDVSSNILALGNVAARVDSIFSSYTSMQLRLENASERVANAQDNLKTSQYNLNKVMQSGTASAEDITEAQRKVDHATRSLTISQNNLERTQNRVIGTYINIGMQSVSLIASLPKLTGVVHGLTASFTALNISTGGWIVIAGAAVTTIALISKNMKDKNKNVNELTSSNYSYESSLSDVNTQLTNMNSNVAQQPSLINSTIDPLEVYIAKLEELIKKEKELADIQKKKEQYKEWGITPVDIWKDIPKVEKKESFIEATAREQREADIKWAEEQKRIAPYIKAEENEKFLAEARRTTINVTDGLSNVEMKAIQYKLQDTEMSKEQQEKWIDLMYSGNELNKAEAELAKQTDQTSIEAVILSTSVDQLKKKFRETWDEINKIVGGGGGGGGGGGRSNAQILADRGYTGPEYWSPSLGYPAGTGQTAPITTTYNSQGNITSRTIKKKDFLMKASGEVVNFDKNDNIIGFKGNLGYDKIPLINKVTVNIDGQAITQIIGRTVAEALSSR